MAVSKRTRFEVLRRDNHACRYCGATAPDVKLTVDHVIPTALGGSGDPDNLVTACAACNSGKTSTSPSEELVAEVDQTAVKWAWAIAAAAEKLAAKRDLENEYLDTFEITWTLYLPANWRNSLAAIRISGLPIAEVLDAAQVAQTARYVDNRFAYFCGVCWKRTNAMQKLALEIIEEDGLNG